MEETELWEEQGYKGIAKRLVSQGQWSLFLQFTSWKLSLILGLISSPVSSCLWNSSVKFVSNSFLKTNTERIIALLWQPLNNLNARSLCIDLII